VDHHRPVEFSVEVNLASLDETKARILRDSGVGRISMGVQSFHDDELKVLDRIHRAADIAPSVEIVRQAGFSHLNLDLIFGIPGQTPASWSESLRGAVSLGVDHLSCYGLTYEPGTPLHACRQAGEIEAVSEEAERDMILHAIDYLSGEGIEQYEISNFARPNARCEHNLRYWRNEPVLGVGPSAASYVEGIRWRNVPDTAQYTSCIREGQSTVVGEERLSPLERAGETAMLSLRTKAGIECRYFEEATSFDPWEIFGEVVARHVDAGLMEADCERIALTREGMLVADSVLSDFLSPGDEVKTA
jgi:oxygen-independent coproporphyrinogen-3 oxidase